MVLKNLIVCLIFGAFLCRIDAQYANCDRSGRIGAAGQSITLNHLASYGTCRYKVTAPADTFIQLTCTLKVQGTSCNNQKLVVSRSGSLDLRDGRNYCNSGRVTSKSIGNEIVVAFNSNFANNGNFQCTFVVVAPSNGNCDCGWNVQNKIVGGSQTGVNEFVSHAGLYDTQTRDMFCGGFIVKQNWVVTAAHCFDAFPNAGSTAVVVGDHNIRLGGDTPWAAVYKVSRYIKHGGYRADTNANDIALVMTETYIKYNPGVGPACLPYTFNGVNFEGSSLTAVGWGTTSYAGPSSDVLLKTSLRVISNPTCASSMNNIDSTKFCTYGDGVRDTCGKDSGGGLYLYAGHQFVIGVVSHGTYCASKYPSVNSRVSSYIGWIESNVGGFFCRMT